MSMCPLLYCYITLVGTDQAAWLLQADWESNQKWMPLSQKDGCLCLHKEGVCRQDVTTQGVHH